EKKNSLTSDDEQAIIIEIDGDVDEHATFVENHYPYIDVVATYDTLFNGIALKAPKKKLHKIASLDFIQSVHPVRTYEIPSSTLHNVENKKAKSNDFMMTSSGNTFADITKRDEFSPLAVLPNDINDTAYTGKGVKVGV